MDNNTMGANEFTIEELEALFNSESQTDTPTSEDDTTDVQDGDDIAGTTDKSNNVETTKAFATRLRASTEKARKEERELLAKQFGYNSYDDMVKDRERNTIRDKGYDPEELAPLVEELVKQRIEADPRMKELEGYRNRNVADFAKQELAAITKLTGGKITSLTQLSPETIERWKETGSLKSAFLEKEGENLITTIRSEQSKGDTSHMQMPSGSSVTPSNERPLTDEEKKMWRYFNPSITEEELNKKTISK